MKLSKNNLYLVIYIISVNYAFAQTPAFEQLPGKFFNVNGQTTYIRDPNAQAYDLGGGSYGIKSEGHLGVNKPAGGQNNGFHPMNSPPINGQRPLGRNDGFDRTIAEFNYAGSADRHSTHFAGDKTHLFQQNGGFPRERNGFAGRQAQAGFAVGQGQAGYAGGQGQAGYAAGHSQGGTGNDPRAYERTIVENNFGGPARESFHVVAGNTKIVQDNGVQEKGFFGRIFG